MLKPKDEHGFHFLHELGSGAYGVVWLASNEGTGGGQSYAAIKLPKADTVEDLNRLEEVFQEEQKNLERLGEHPNIVRLRAIRRFRTTRGQNVLGLITEFVAGGVDEEGKSCGRDALFHFLGTEDEPFPFELEGYVRFLVQICNALQHAHDLSIYHRDIKPGNILIREEDYSAVLADWGVSKCREASGSWVSSVHGTSHYMAPEVHQAGLFKTSLAFMPPPTSAIDGRADIFSLGITAYRLATRKLPFQGDNLQASIADLDNQQRASNNLLTVIREQELVNIISKMFAYRTDARWQNVTDLKRALQSFMGWSDPVIVRPFEGNTATLHISSEPTGVIVTIDHDAMGNTPLTLALDAGITGRKTCILGVGGVAGYEDSIQELDIVRGETYQLNIPLLKRTVRIILPPNPIRVSEITLLKDHEMVLIPAGEFLMGSNESDTDTFQYEKPQRTIFLDDYRISKFPVTVAQFRKYTEATKQNFDWNGHQPDWGWIDDHPMVKVTWEEARAFCQWTGGDLPTEAQWEKAARGTDGRKYPWGNDWDAKKCRCSINEFGDSGGTILVGSYPQGVSPYGVHDMAGNVLEWCRDYCDQSYYKTALRNNPENLKESSYRVLRGGSWNYYNPQLLRCASRSWYTPTYRLDYVGFRVVAGHK